jgi:hypothetical protein
VSRLRAGHGRGTPRRLMPGFQLAGRREWVSALTTPPFSKTKIRSVQEGQWRTRRRS